jgi:CubicO group peptidase (beta-lactamase class C family)
MVLAVFVAALFVAPVSAQQPAGAALDAGGQFQFLILGAIPVRPDSGAVDPAVMEKSVFAAELIGDGEELAATLDPQPGASVEIRGKTYTWTRLPDDQAGAIVALDKVLGSHEWSVAYASGELDSPQGGPALLGIGSDDAVRVWLNGKLVHSKWVGRPVRTDEDLVPVQLQEGKNRLLVKVVNWTLGWGFACRLVPPDTLSDRLAQAVLQGDRDVVKLLLAHGAAPDAVSRFGVKPVQLAKLRRDDETQKMLLDAGAEDLPPPDPAIIADAALSDSSLAQLPGLSVLVARDGEVIYERAVGLADISEQLPVTTKSKFRIGSVTKQFTASAILKLIEEDKLSLSDTLEEFLPAFPRAGEVTIHQLLTHTSGIPSYTDQPAFYDTITEATSEEALIEKIQATAAQGYSFEPGSDFRYNNSGYFLLGHIVRLVTGEPLGDYLRTTFFEPLGMHDTGMHSSQLELSEEAKGYGFQAGKAELALNWEMSRAGGAGALYSTVHDLMKWNEAVFAGQVLRPETLEKAFHPVEQSGGGMNYGYGWTMGQHRGLPTISHGGGLHGFQSQLVRFPAQNVTIVALHNASPPVPDFAPAALTARLADLFLWKEMDPPPPRQVDPQVDPAIYQRYVGRYDYGPAVMVVSREGDRLFAQLTGQEKYEIYPASPTKFFWKVVEASVEFVLDEQGNCVAGRHTQGPNQFLAKRLKDPQELAMTAEQLDAFVGVYDYQQAKMRITRQGTQLIAQLDGQPALPIFPKDKDLFMWKIVSAEIEFVRDAAGKVTGAVHSQGGQKLNVAKVE